MQTSMFNTPALYGDHHVTEVRKQLLALPGVQAVYASSAFHVVEVTFDDAQVSQEAVERKLDELGYLRELPVMIEPSVAVQRVDATEVFRKTATYENVRDIITFQQTVDQNGHSAWNCPGLGMVQPRLGMVQPRAGVEPKHHEVLP